MSSAIGKHPWLRPMIARDATESHRAATPLELLYDLCFVVAIAQAAHSFHHAVAHGHGGEGLLSFGLVFFAIWWAWMGFTWFASGFDNDDALYRVKVLVQMTGLLILAAGVPRTFDHHDYRVIVVGYVIMRIGLVGQWLRVAKSLPEFRTTALRYAIGVIGCQLGWGAWLVVPESLWLVGFLVLATLELLVPAWAESGRNTPWHPEHILERYGLMTIIVIGESVLAATIAIQKALELGELTGVLVAAVASAPVILFALWWIYFLVRPPVGEASGLRSFLWGYLHFFVFASAAALGAGLGIWIDIVTHDAHLDAAIGDLALAIPVALYLASLGILRTCLKDRVMVVLFVAAFASLGAAFVPYTPAAIAGLLALLTTILVRWESTAASP